MTDLLQQIDQLYTELGEEQVNISCIPRVNRHSSDEEMKFVLKLLQVKQDSITKLPSMTQKILIAFVHGLQYIFDQSPYREYMRNAEGTWAEQEERRIMDGKYDKIYTELDTKYT